MSLVLKPVPRVCEWELDCPHCPGAGAHKEHPPRVREGHLSEDLLSSTHRTKNLFIPEKGSGVFAELKSAVCENADSINKINFCQLLVHVLKFDFTSNDYSYELICMQLTQDTRLSCIHVYVPLF